MLTKLCQWADGFSLVLNSSDCNAYLLMALLFVSLSNQVLFTWATIDDFVQYPLVIHIIVVHPRNQYCQEIFFCIFPTCYARHLQNRGAEQRPLYWPICVGFLKSAVASAQRINWGSVPVKNNIIWSWIKNWCLITQYISTVLDSWN